MSIWSDRISATPAGPSRDWRRQRRPQGLEVRTLATHLRLRRASSAVTVCYHRQQAHTPEGSVCYPAAHRAAKYHPALRSEKDFDIFRAH